MFLQHWAKCCCRRTSVGQTITAAGVSPHVLTTRHQLAAIAMITPSKTWEYMWCKVLYFADLFCLHGNIRSGNITISLFFCALKLFFDFFVFLVKAAPWDDINFRF